MRRRSQALYRAAIWALLAAVACASAPVVKQVPTPRPWPPGSYPLDARLSTELDPCQRSAVHAAIGWWESLVGADMLTPRDVPPIDAAILGVPTHRVVAFLPSAGLRTPLIRGEADPWVELHTHSLYAVIVYLVGCSPRVAAHEIGHALGLVHSGDPSALMFPVHHVDSWAVTEQELRIVRGNH